MANLLAGVWNWATGRRSMPNLPPNMIYEKDVSSDNDFWISCVFDPTMDIMYVNGVVTDILDTDKCLIDGRYHYQPKTEREIRNFPYIEINSSVRISLYRKKNSNTEWKVASCFLTNNKPCHQAVRHRSNSFTQVHQDELTVQAIETANNKLNKNVDNETMSVEVMGDMPKIVCFEKESIIQILFKNNSYAKEEELLDYRIPWENRSQLSIVDKVEVPVKIGIQSHYIFDIQLTGKYLGRSTEKVEFIFKDITYKVGINIHVTDSRIIISDNAERYSRPEIDMKRLFELQNDFIIPGVKNTNRVQFPAVKIRNWNIPSQLMKCFWTEDGKYNCNINEIKDKISKLYPAAFETLTYQNYKAKFHTLLFIDEVETLSALQKYAKERINFEHCGEYLILKIPDLSEQRPSLIPGDRVTVTDPPNCKKQLGDNPGRYEGIIHKVMANEIWLKFDPVFHQICGHWDFSVNFFSSRMMARKQHEVINELWGKNRLGERFLFPFKDDLDYQLPKLIIENIDEMIDLDNLNKENKTLVMRPKVIRKLTWFNKSLNNEQQKAVISILKNEARPMPYVIYGPPGTGKTVTLTESIIQVYKEFPKSKLLICAPTNSAVDLLLIKLVASGLFDKTIIKRLISFSHYMSSSYNQDYDEYCAFPEFESSNFGSQPQEKDSKFVNKRDILKLRIIITTEGTASVLYTMGFKNKTFTHIFIDEAGQSMEPELLLPLSLLDPYQNGQVILAGDPQQLGPVVFSLMAKSNGLGLSMLNRFINYPSYRRDPNLFPEYNGFNPKVITHLVKNYRSVPEIVHNFSKLFYNSLLEATILDDNLPEKVFLKNLNSDVQWSIGCKGPVIVHGIVGEDSQEPSSPSWFNPHEAFQVLLYVTNLIKAGVAANDIGIISPYTAQVAKINEILKMYHPDVKLPKVGTVEMFQGQERMVIIISIVRSKSKTGAEKDKKFNLGFLTAKERTNVAISRAKSLTIVIGDPFTLLCNHQWKYILLQAYKNNNYVGCNFSEKLN